MANHDPSKPLAGQAALVTGGGGGLGRAIAIAFAQGGANVLIADIVPERCEEAAERVRELGQKAIPCPTDVTDVEQVRAAVEKAASEFGRLDILVNNAGGTGRRNFADMSERSWRKHIDLNLVSMFAATSAAIPHMIEGGRGGSIINVTSIEASRAAPMFSVYSACKAGMNNFTRTMALELGDHQIRVNALAPDYTETPGLRGNISGPVDESKWYPMPPEHVDLINRRMPLGRGGLPEETGQAALFLASPAASYITGIILPIDGGAWASSGWLRDQQGQWCLGEPTLPTETE